MTVTDLDAWARRAVPTGWSEQGLHWHLMAVDVSLPRSDTNTIGEAERRRQPAQHVATDPEAAAAWLAERARDADGRAVEKWAGKSSWAQGFDWVRDVIARGLAAGRIDPAVPGGNGPVRSVTAVRISDTQAVELWALDFTAADCPQGHG